MNASSEFTPICALPVMSKDGFVHPVAARCNVSIYGASNIPSPQIDSERLSRRQLEDAGAVSSTSASTELTPNRSLPAPLGLGASETLCVGAHHRAPACIDLQRGICRAAPEGGIWATEAHFNADGAAAAASRSFVCLVAGGRYELYSHYPLKIQAVAASLTTPA
jgi:hypothetical protein